MDQKYFIKKRSKYSDDSAIELISKFGISKVKSISTEVIKQEYVSFVHLKLDGDQLLFLIKEIHECSHNNQRLVHGDFSRNNTTIYKGEPKCFDYEHAHWGNPYVDLGRLLLREYTVLAGIDFLHEYKETIPSPEELKNGLIHFCIWQHLIRKEKGLNHINVPLIRAKRVKTSSDSSLKKILSDFKAHI